MPVNADWLQKKLLSAFPNAILELVDLVGDENHYRVTITDSSFVGVNKVAQHRMVNQALAGVLGEELHALQIITKTPN